MEDWGAETDRNRSWLNSDRVSFRAALMVLGNESHGRGRQVGRA